MLAIHESATHVQRRRINLLYAEQLQTNACADNIDDGVNGPDLVKMNLFYGRAMHLCFGLCETPKNGNSSLLNAGSQLAAFDDLHDMREVAVGMLFSHFDIEFGRRHT